ncbi:hypothetical protein DU478_21495 [Thalassococcus profundi]|uniref:Uncharacterized protein n=1 Tax=Thalassococcus profundi TaxID=2282382 RepID=A0A369TG13_9RHOB|nr:hypothetical protein [Thalassococcus profundi]RDD64190.1 hypothetical protein DU478_21495 [Thalassococcus profundi]
MTMPIMDEDYERVPGLFRAWDFGILLEQGCSYRVEDGGRTDDGQPLYLVFCKAQAWDLPEVRHDA